MREDAAENIEGGDGHGEATTSETASGERRRSIVELQNMLRRVSQSPFHNQYKGGEWSAAATDVTDNVEPQRNGVNGSSSRMNPFYAYYLENKGDITEDKRKKTSESVDCDSIFVPPPDFQNSPLDLPSENKTEENGGMFPEPKNNLFKSQNDNNDKDLFHRSVPSHNATANGFHDVTLNSPNLFKASPAHGQNLSKSFPSRSSDLFKGEEDDLFQAVKNEDLFETAWAKKAGPFDKPASTFVDPFTSPLNKEDDLFQTPKSAVANSFYTATEKVDDLFQSPQPFYTAPTKETDLFQVDSTKKDRQDTKEKELVGLSFKENLSAFSTSSTNSVDPFASPIAKDLFQDVSSLGDPFGSTPFTKYDPFQDISSGTPDIFQRLPSQRKASKNIASNSSYSSLNSPSELKLDVPDASSSHVFKKSKAPPPVPPKPFQKPQEITLTTPQGTKHDILQPTPIIQAGDLSDSPGQSPSRMNNMQSFKRPPKPLPRIRHRRPERPPQPEKPPKPEIAPQLESPSEPEPSVPKVSPKPSFKNLKPITRRKQKTPEMKSVEPENYVVFEDILLIGQERCVEDWPDDSPQLDPNFKPSGTLRLRRESLKAMADSDGGSSEDGSLSKSKKKNKTFRMSHLSRRGSKSKSPDDINNGKSNTPPLTSKSSKEQFSELHMSAEELEDNKEMDYKKKTVKPKVSHLFRRPSANSPVMEEKDMNGHSPYASKGAALEQSSGEEGEEGETHGEKTKKSLKVKFVPRRGFVIAPVKTNDDSKGAHGYTPHKGSKEKSHDGAFGAHGYTPDKKTSWCAEELESEELHEMEDCKPKKSKPKPPRPVPRKPKTAKGQSEPIGFSYHTPQQASSNVFAEDYTADRDFRSPGEMYDEDEQDEVDFYKPKKTSKLPKSPKKVPKNLKRKGKVTPHADSEDPPGASNYLSEAARAEWRAAQMDEQALAENETEDDDGDTDSLMEWWNTVEQWDEVASDDEEIVMKDDSKSFTILADKVHRGLRVFNKVFTERAEVLWQDIIKLHAIADDINEFHQKAKIAGITGGTTTAVGGVTAIAGLALAPFTFGASLVITAVGVGVAAAGGITSASAAISDNVNNMQDQKKVEIVLQEYETHLLDINKILHFVNEGLYKLRGHPFLRSGTQHYSEDWEIRRAVQMISLVDSPVMRATEITDGAVASVQGLFKGMDKYFTKDSRELKKSCKTEMVARLKQVAAVLNDTIVELNTIREELQETTGSI
ncbi:uncharacterized protein si:cabz01007807.1 isoform X2 [Oreochromis aureus]|uniref:uncharacterized protein si:cabz01007807.1 isoform X2 n=1 Tax=Oreochromis aureus TaxID=47969 RepID=UPI0012BBE242|nr:uncharacterized protein si:cabz01007807.1 isoform X2 [Oreochromis aureus]